MNRIEQSGNTVGSVGDWRPGCSLGVLKKRAWMLSRIRAYFRRQRVLEVETPSLCRRVGPDPNLDYFTTEFEYPGGRDVQRLYLQTSPEFSMKRLLAGGSGSIYQICKAYRNSESGRLHNPEFTILEWYRVGFDLSRLMDEIEHLLGRVLGLSASGEAPVRFSYQQVFLHHCGLDPLSAELKDYLKRAEDLQDQDAVAICGEDIRLWQEYLFGCRIQPHLGRNGLCLVYDYPVNQCALARVSPHDTRVAERVEVFFQGVELANGFRELSCEAEQRDRFQQDLAVRKRLGKALPAIDERLLGALEAGLPECSGVAVGLDRVLMLLVKAASIDEVLSFALPRA